MEYLSQECYDRLTQELNELVSVELPKARNELEEARAKGDLSENFEYHAAKRAHGRLLSRISYMQKTLRFARVMDTSRLDNDTVGLLRRVEMDRGKTAAAEDELHYGDIRYSATENAVFCGSTIVALTQTELRLLSYMMKQPEKAYSREELLSAVWGFDSEVETRVTDETLRRIRKKLLQAGSTVSVSTIWGFGYKLKGAECT